MIAKRQSIRTVGLGVLMASAFAGVLWLTSGTTVRAQAPAPAADPQDIAEGIGNSHFVHVPYNSYPTADGHIIVACIGDAFFERFAEFIGIPELLEPSLRKQAVRYASKARIDALVAAKMQTRTTADWQAQLQAARIPCGPVNNFRQALDDNQVRARDMVLDVQLHSGETVQMPGNPIKLSAAQARPTIRPPQLGEHTQEVLGGLVGYSAEQLAQLRASGAIA